MAKSTETTKYRKFEWNDTLKRVVRRETPLTAQERVKRNCDVCGREHWMSAGQVVICKHEKKK